MLVRNRFVRLTAISAGLLLIGALGACGSGSNSNSKGTGKTRIAFIGYAKSNSYAQAAFKGVEKYAKSKGASAVFIDANFDPTTQVQQIQDATASGRYNALIIQPLDGTAVIPAVKAAVRAKITVVAEDNPMGTRYDTAKPQVAGTYYVGSVPTEDGTAQGKLLVGACEGVTDCKVAYLTGDSSLPLDNARRSGAMTVLKAKGVSCYCDLEGGYTQAQGRSAIQDLLQAHPDVDVILGSSQALLGGESLLPSGGKIKLVSNGNSIQAIQRIQSGRWFGAEYFSPVEAGALAAKVAIQVRAGKDVPGGTNVMKALQSSIAYGDAKALKGVVGDYRD